MRNSFYAIIFLIMQKKFFGIIVQIKDYNNSFLIKIITNEDEILSGYTKNINIYPGVFIHGFIFKNNIEIDEALNLLPEFSNIQKIKFIEILNLTKNLKANNKQNNIFQNLHQCLKTLMINEEKALAFWHSVVN